VPGAALLGVVPAGLSVVGLSVTLVSIGGAAGNFSSVAATVVAVPSGIASMVCGDIGEVGSDLVEAREFCRVSLPVVYYSLTAYHFIASSWLFALKENSCF